MFLSSSTVSSLIMCNIGYALFTKKVCHYIKLPECLFLSLHFLFYAFGLNIFYFKLLQLNIRTYTACLHLKDQNEN